MGEGRSHEPVLLRETLEQLAIRTDGFYIDATYGRGGHARGILERLGPEGQLWLLDRDPQACAHAREHFGGDARVHIVQDAFMSLPDRLAAAHRLGQLDGLLLDLGVSSAQLEEPDRGFSFQADGPLDMRMSREGPTAAEWLAEVDEAELARVLETYGEERQARRIARHIVRSRADQPVQCTGQLAELVAQARSRDRAKPPRRHPATRVFQAIRIFINRELEQLESLLDNLLALLAAEARLAIISFHSLEDRRVKQFLRACSEPPAGSRHRPAPPFVPSLHCYPLIRPTDEEIARNPRARSARLRSARRLS